jgi:hypothetical protein
MQAGVLAPYASPWQLFLAGAETYHFKFQGGGIFPPVFLISSGPPTRLFLKRTLLLLVDSIIVHGFKVQTIVFIIYLSVNLLPK